MKKHLLALAALAALSAPAFAQSDVTLYGIADVGVATVSNKDGQHWSGQDSGRLQSSRFGLRGSEDLGGGLRANFTLESGLSLTTGASASSTVLFNRQAFMGLSSPTWGAVTMGRQYTPIYDFLILQSGAPTFGVAGGAVDGIAPGVNAAARFDNTIGGTRIDSAFKYTTPSFGGVRAMAMLTRDDGGARGQFQSVALGYASGPLTVSLAMHKSDCLKSAPCSALKGNDELVGIGGGYDFGVARVGVIYTSQKNAKNVRGNNADVFSVLATVPVGLWSLSAGYQTLNDKTALNQDIRQFNLAALYLLSKRTALYSAYTAQKVDNGGKAGMALMNSSTSKQNQLSVGVRHAF